MCRIRPNLQLEESARRKPLFKIAERSDRISGARRNGRRKQIGAGGGSAPTQSSGGRTVSARADGRGGSHPASKSEFACARLRVDDLIDQDEGAGRQLRPERAAQASLILFRRRLAPMVVSRSTSSCARRPRVAIDKRDVRHYRSRCSREALMVGAPKCALRGRN